MVEVVVAFFLWFFAVVVIWRIFGEARLEYVIGTPCYWK